MNRRQFLTAAAAAPAVLAAAPDTGFTHARGRDILSPKGEPILLRGINLGNWLVNEGYMFLFEQGPVSGHELERFFEELAGPEFSDAFWREYRRQYINASDIAFIAKCGFNHVRIPLHYKFFIGDDGGFALLDPVIAACRKAGLLAMLDMHCAPGGQTGANIDDSVGYPWLFDSPREQQRLISVWTAIARHYRDDTTILAYDLLNEPIPHVPPLRSLNERLEPLYKRVTAAIRAVDPNHAICLGGAQWDSNFDVFGQPFDNNLIYQFHKYWTPPGRESIDAYLKFRDRYNVPIWCGESGENDDHWVAAFVKTLESNKVGWCFWPYKKMQKTSCVVSFRAPEGWDKIVKMAAMPAGTGNAEKRVDARPSPADCQRMLSELLQNIKLENASVNKGYLQALGMRAG